MSITILTLFETGRAKMPTFVFFFKYLQNEKRYDFALLWLLVIIYSERSCQISLENFDWLTIYCDFVRGVPKIQKSLFFESTVFVKYFKYTLCWSGKYDKYIRIGNFVVFYHKAWKLLQMGFFIYFVKQFASICLFFSFQNKECHSLSFITAVYS